MHKQTPTTTGTETVCTDYSNHLAWLVVCRFYGCYSGKLFIVTNFSRWRELHVAERLVWMANVTGHTTIHITYPFAMNNMVHKWTHGTGRTERLTMMWFHSKCFIVCKSHTLNHNLPLWTTHTHTSIRFWDPINLREKDASDLWTYAIRSRTECPGDSGLIRVRNTVQLSTNLLPDLIAHPKNVDVYLCICISCLIDTLLHKQMWSTWRELCIKKA